MPDVGDGIVLQMVWRVSGTATDDAATTASVLKPDGTTASLTVTHAATGTYTAPLTFTSAGTWVVTWTAPTLVQVEELSFDATSNPRYFGLGELRALPDMSSVATYTDATLSTARDWIEALVERECGASFVAKPDTITLSGSGTEQIVLPAPWVREVTACSIDGTALDAGELALIVVQPGGMLYRRSAAGATTWQTWPDGLLNVTVTYTSGYSATPPADLKEQMMVAARIHILEARSSTGLPSRATSITNEYGNVSLSTPGEGRPTGVPSVDACILGWAQRVNVFGFA